MPHLIILLLWWRCRGYTHIRRGLLRCSFLVRWAMRDALKCGTSDRYSNPRFFVSCSIQFHFIILNNIAGRVVCNNADKIRMDKDIFIAQFHFFIPLQRIRKKYHERFLSESQFIEPSFAVKRHETDCHFIKLTNKDFYFRTKSKDRKSTRLNSSHQD